MTSPIIVKGIGSKKYDASKYIKIQLYLPGKDGTALIEREFYIINNLIAKALIGINIMNPESIVINLDKDVVRAYAPRRTNGAEV